eukprot:gnl/MRDRNA2_/MRDRNA2_178932_c0_seq1.p1 gnl/MRDRNA2_/MRDRNA2_178932_c0~~gnl/MRDRNA2_/MRDRNA2_178932_c0_seq1.p1  ORF type:complete len:113 (-),score=11.94 gnl/MRDRNA2_/MRDRNA2_178932_c0_seq1:90-428(-)
MGNQAYAVRPQGAARLIKYLQKRPIMDSDGAIMPQDQNQEKLGWETVKGIMKVDLPPWVNTYVSKFNLLKHMIRRFESDRIEPEAIALLPKRIQFKSQSDRRFIDLRKAFAF